MFNVFVCFSFLTVTGGQAQGRPASDNAYNSLQPHQQSTYNVIQRGIPQGMSIRQERWEGLGGLVRSLQTLLQLCPSIAQTRVRMTLLDHAKVDRALVNRWCGLWFRRLWLSMRMHAAGFADEYHCLGTI